MQIMLAFLFDNYHENFLHVHAISNLILKNNKQVTTEFGCMCTKS